MRAFHLAFRGLATVALVPPALGCGSTAPTGDGAGALATCGSSCTPTQVAASCAATCDKIARSACASGVGGGGSDCAMSCEAASMSAPCASSAYDYLRCVESVQPTCSPSGSVQFVGCDSRQQALQACLARGSSTPPTSGGGPAGNSCAAPTAVCPAIPRPSLSGAMSCSGGGGGGPNGVVTSSTSCQDSAGNVWQADCTGSTCTCTFNGGQSCSCTMTAPPGTCNSCCPGTG